MAPEFLPEWYRKFSEDNKMTAKFAVKNAKYLRSFPSHGL